LKYLILNFEIGGILILKCGRLLEAFPIRGDGHGVEEVCLALFVVGCEVNWIIVEL